MSLISVGWTGFQPVPMIVLVFTIPQYANKGKESLYAVPSKIRHLYPPHGTDSYGGAGYFLSVLTVTV
jgi:hypothetical protein